MCHIEDESSWTINVKLSFVLTHLPMWHPTGRPKWSFKYLRENASKACPQWAFIHLSFFPHTPAAFLPVTWQWNRIFWQWLSTENHPGPSVLLYTSAQWPPQQVTWWDEGAHKATWRTLPKYMCFHCSREKWSFKLIKGGLEHKETWTTNSYNAGTSPM